MKHNICTYNIRCDVKEDGPNAFPHRKALIKAAFPSFRADIIGFQELQDHMLAWLEETFTDYTFVGIGREADLHGEHTTIAFRTARYTLVSLDNFWLSETPRVAGSCFGSDQSIYCRLCTVAVLCDKETNKLLRVYNTHLDHTGIMAQVQAISLILSRIADDERIWPSSAVILTGDFNAKPDSMVCRSVSSFRLGEKKLQDVTTAFPFTFHAYHPENGGSKIDYIYTPAPCDTEKTHLVTHCADGVYLSDHYPIVAEIEW